ncbi:FRG domain-containing protein [Acinetobacter radioresistens]|uniref:FRG domain-containing protein n=1 Tax=Acinetobacter radioresistens TaxID=40216 RepID=UPI0022476348|nr:FRG domain-containing protein [Acinetobacter radioresistens]MCX0337460.1 FRG domain-containing protein [Acinetobacter radioresistens]
MVEDLLGKLEEKNGYFELQINTMDELLDLIRPEKSILSELMKKLRYKFYIHQSEFSYDTENLLYRGMGDAVWELEPSISRVLRSQPYYNDFEILRAGQQEYLLLRDFQAACDSSAVQLPNDSIFSRHAQEKSFTDNFPYGDSDEWFNESYLELVAFAQHYGVPTRFLDWTSHPLVAAYFAVSGVFSEDSRGGKIKDFSIWIFNTTHIDLLPPEVKIVKVPTSINSHAASQQGCFTMVRQQEVSNYEVSYIKLNDCFEFYKTPWRLLKLKIGAVLARSLFDFCDAYNFNATYLFRGPHGAAKHAMDLWNRDSYGKTHRH